jgi:hypothetical protein
MGSDQSPASPRAAARVEPAEPTWMAQSLDSPPEKKVFYQV